MDTLTITGKTKRPDPEHGTIEFVYRPEDIRLTDEQRTFWLETIVPNLRKGNRRQASNTLRKYAHNGYAYCCLGSATLDVRAAGVLVDQCTASLQRMDVLDADVARYLGTTPNGGGFIWGKHRYSDSSYGPVEPVEPTNLNDSYGFTFKQIADVIEFSLTGTVKRLEGGHDA